MTTSVRLEAAAHPTRRRLIRNLTVVVGMVGAYAAAPAPGRAERAKLAPTDVAYRPETKSRARCETCVNWLAPDACKLVAGPISPSGTCGLYVRKL
jgi:hypothetical protein